MIRRFTFLLACLALAAVTTAQNRPWKNYWTHITTVQAGSQSGKVYLWMPPPDAASVQAGRNFIKGMVIASYTIAEDGFVKDSSLRAACARQGLAIVYIRPSPVSQPQAGSGDTAFVTAVLRKLAQDIDQPEFARLPWCPFGHSTSSAFVRQLTFWHPERTFGSITYKGGKLNNDYFPTHNAIGVPLLGVNGEFEEYGPYDNSCQTGRIDRYNYFAMRDTMQAKKRRGQATFTQELMLQGEGHFPYTKDGAGLIAQFVEKAAQYRINPNGGPLLDIDTTRTWALDTNQVTQAPVADTISRLGGTQPIQNMFDREQALAWQAYINARVGRQRSRAGTNGSCGNVERLNAPVDQSPLTLPTNAFTRAPYVRVISGQARPLSGTTFEFNPAQFADGADLWLSVEVPFDGINKTGTRPYRVVLQSNTGGAAQTITHNLPAEILDSTCAGSLIVHGPFSGRSFGERYRLNLHATSSSGLPVSATIISGPAQAVNDSVGLVDTVKAAANDTSLITVRFVQAGDNSHPTTTLDVPVRLISLPYVVCEAVKERVRPTLGLAPNPTTGQVTLQLSPQATATQLIVTDATGRQVKAERIPTGAAAYQADLSALPTGVYMLQVGQAHARVVLQGR